MIFKIIKALLYRVEQIYNRITIYNLFAAYGKGSSMNRPLIIGKPKNIFIGNNVAIQFKAWLTANPQTGNKSAELVIMDGSRIGNFNHIYATSSIILEKNV